MIIRINTEKDNLEILRSQVLALQEIIKLKEEQYKKEEQIFKRR